MKFWRSLTGLFRKVRANRSDDETKTPPNRSRPLRLTLLVAVTVALLPIAIATIVQGLDRAEGDIAAARDHLVQTTQAASSSEENMLATAEQITRALANFPQVRDAGPNCNDDLAGALKGLTFIANISRQDSNGVVICSAIPAAVGLSAKGRPIWQAAPLAHQFLVSGRILGRITHRPVIVGLLPLWKNGRFDGALTVSIDVSWLDYILGAKDLPHDSIVAIFDKTGAIIASNRLGDAATIFKNAASIVHQPESLFTAYDSAGHAWTYSTGALLGHNVFVGFAMRQSSLFRPAYIHVGADFVLPFLMLALTWIAIWIVTERQITRWTIYLKRISAAYQAGRYTVRPVLTDAPTEFQLLGQGMADMANSIQDRDQSLRELLAQKTHLVREIHHRVKNNLQVVISLLSIQANEMHDPAAKEALRQARSRIDALALVHRILHEDEGRNTIDLKRLLEEITRQTAESLLNDRLDVVLTTELIPCEISGEQAVPIALYASEALNSIIKHGYPRGMMGARITVALQPGEDGKLELSIKDDGNGFDSSACQQSVGSRLIRGLAMQAGGISELSACGGNGTIVTLRFPDPRLKIAA